jgi:hypothetical protein
MQTRTRRMVLFSVVALGLFMLPANSALAQGNSSLGTWKLNVAKSKWEPGPPPKGEMRVYEVWEKDGVKATQTRVLADGKTLTLNWAAHYDGKDYKYSGSPDYDTIAITRVDANTTDATQKLGGKVMVTVHTVISSDGKTRTVTSKGTNAKGQAVSSVQVYDKQ